MNVPPALCLKDASRIYGTPPNTVTALDSVTFNLAPGQFAALMGPSGSGKSTLLNIAGALDRPSSGSVTIAGQDLAMLDANSLARVRRRNIGFVFQDFNLLPSLTAVENVAFPLELDDWTASRARSEAMRALRLLEVDDLASRLPQDMSGGQAQRVAIARAVVGDRTLLLADEPTGALDSETAAAVISLLRDRADEGSAVLLATHEHRFAAWADRTLFLRDGRLVGMSEPDDIDALLRMDEGPEDFGEAPREADPNSAQGQYSPQDHYSNPDRYADLDRYSDPDADPETWQ